MDNPAAEIPGPATGTLEHTMSQQPPPWPNGAPPPRRPPAPPYGYGQPGANRPPTGPYPPAAPPYGGYPSSAPPYGTYSQGWSDQQPDRPPTHQPHSPNAPLGERPPERVSIDEFRTPKRRTPLIVGIVTGVVLIAIVVAAFFLMRPGGGTASPTPTPTTPPIPSSTRTPTAQGSPWVSKSDNASGWWEITSERWTSSNEVVVEISIEVDSGSLSYDFYAWNNNETSRATHMSSSAPSPQLRAGRVGTGQKVKGYVSFRIAQGPGTVLMMNDNLDAVSGLPLKG